MKLSTIYIVLFSFLVFFSSCKNDVLNAGASTLDTEDEIRVKSDTFAFASSLQECTPIYLTPDSFLLGECDTHFGTIKADILAQLACPEGFQYPDTMIVNGDTIDTQLTVDSVCLFLFYQNWYGDGYAPLGISVYEMDRSTLDYGSRYPSDTAILSFCSLEDSTRISQHSRIVFASQPADSVYYSDGTASASIRIKLTDAFAKRFFQVRDFSSQEAFCQLFKGLYLVSDFGGSTVLYVKNISMSVYYHFSLPRQNQQDTIVQDKKTFYANSEVRQINRYIYPDREDIIEELKTKPDTNYIISPANIYTRLSLRMDSIYQRIREQLGNLDDYRVYVNRANLTIDVLYDNAPSSRPRDEWDMPAAYMLLVQEDKMESFFSSNELPTDTTAILGTLTANTDTLGNITYYYSYNLSSLLTQQLRLLQQDPLLPSEELNFLLVPVAVKTTSSATSSAITAVKPLQTISATQIRSAHYADDHNAMDLEVVYSGFNKMK